MWITEASAETTASPAEVWKLYENVAEWKTWDHGIEASSIDGEFVVGATGALKPKGGPRSKFVLTLVEPDQGFADRTRLPLTSLEFEHVLEPLPTGTRITHRVRMQGPLTFLFSRVIGKNIAAGLPEAVAALAARASRG